MDDQPRPRSAAGEYVILVYCQETMSHSLHSGKALNDNSVQQHDDNPALITSEGRERGGKALTRPFSSVGPAGSLCMDHNMSQHRLPARSEAVQRDGMLCGARARTLSDSHRVLAPLKSGQILLCRTDGGPNRVLVTAW